LRFLVVHPGPSWSVSDVYNGWVEALEQLGQQVNTFNLDARLTLWSRAMVETGQVDEHGAVGLRRAVDDESAVYLASEGVLSAAYKCLPDIVLVISCMFVSVELLDILRARGHKVVLVHTESPYDEDNQVKLSAHSDLSVINDPTHLERYRDVASTYYQPHCYRPSVHHPGPPSPGMASDFCFVGTGFPSRIEFLEQMKLDAIDVLLAGQWKLLAESDSVLRKYLAHDLYEGLDNDQAAQVYRSSRTSLNLYRREADRPELAAGYAMSPRELEMAACGLWFARDSRPEGDELLPLPTFTSPEHASELVRWFLAHDGPRQAMADAAREAVAERTFTNAAKRLLELLDRRMWSRLRA
jgi:spore maturation protein CgeB